MKNTARKTELGRIQLFLRIKHPDIDPSEISKALELQPEHTIKSGPSVSARGVKKIHSESYWLCTLPVPSIGEMVAWAAQMHSLSEHPVHGSPETAWTKLPALRLARSSGVYDMQLIAWLKKLERQRSFIKKMVDEGGTVALVLQRASRTAPLTIGPALTARLGELEISLEID